MSGKFELAVQNGEGASSPDVIKRRKQANNYVIIESIREEKKNKTTDPLIFRRWRICQCDGQHVEGIRSGLQVWL